MAIFNFNDLSKQSKIGYNALYNVIFSHSTSFNSKDGLNKFTVPLCLNSDNKVSLTEKNFIFFDSVLSELKLFGFYNIVSHNGRAVDDVKTDFSTVEIVLSKEQKSIVDALTPIKNSDGLKNFDFSNVDTTKLLKRDGKAEKAKTEENKKVEAKKAEVVATAEKVVSENEELKNENKALKASADKFNAEVEKDNAEILQNCIKSYTEMICKLFGEDVDKEQKKAVAKMLSNFAVAISE